MTWLDRIKEIARREREADPSNTAVTGQLDIRYFKKDHIESLLYDVSLELLGEIPVDEIATISSHAVVTVNFDTSAVSPGDPPFPELPLNTIDVIGASVDGGPVIPTSISGYLQKRGVVDGSSVYTFAYDATTYGMVTPTARIYYTGVVLKMILLVEPTLADFQADHPIIPPGYDEELIARVRRRLHISDFMPRGAM
jgi:hypothetical protein